MEFCSTDYILGIWFASDKDGNDCYIFVKRDKNGIWQGKITYRYDNKESTNPFDGKDKKRVQLFSSKEPNEPDSSIFLSVSEIFQKIITKYNTFNDFLLVRGGIDEFLELAKTKNWMHMKIERVH